MALTDGLVVMAVLAIFGYLIIMKMRDKSKTKMFDFFSRKPEEQPVQPLEVSKQIWNDNRTIM